MTNSDILKASWADLKGRWTPVVLASLAVFVLILCVTTIITITAKKFDWNEVVQIVFTFVAGIFVLYPLYVGFIYAVFEFFFKDSSEQPAQTAADILSRAIKLGFGNYRHVVEGMFVYAVVLLAGLLLLVVPGVIFSLSFFAVPFLIVEEPELGIGEILTKSRKMMEGYKLQLFLMMLIFLGITILGYLTLFIGFIWILPFEYVVLASFYRVVKENYESTL